MINLERQRDMVIPKILGPDSVYTRHLQKKLDAVIFELSAIANGEIVGGLPDELFHGSKTRKPPRE